MSHVKCYTSPLRGLGDVARRDPKLSSHTFCFERNIFREHRGPWVWTQPLTNGQAAVCRVRVTWRVAVPMAPPLSARMEHGKRLRTRAYGRGGVLWLKALV